MTALMIGVRDAPTLPQGGGGGGGATDDANDGYRNSSGLRDANMIVGAIAAALEMPT